MVGLLTGGSVVGMIVPDSSGWGREQGVLKWELETCREEVGTVR